MIERFQRDLAVIEEIYEEFLQYRREREQFLEKYEALHASYQSKELEYFTFQKKLNSLLEGRSKKEIIDGMDAYMFDLLRRIETVRSELFHVIYDDRSEETLKVHWKPVAVPRAAVEKQPWYGVFADIGRAIAGSLGALFGHKKTVSSGASSSHTHRSNEPLPEELVVGKRSLDSFAGPAPNTQKETLTRKGKGASGEVGSARDLVAEEGLEVGSADERVEEFGGVASGDVTELSPDGEPYLPESGGMPDVHILSGEGVTMQGAGEPFTARLPKGEKGRAARREKVRKQSFFAQLGLLFSRRKRSNFQQILDEEHALAKGARGGVGTGAGFVDGMKSGAEMPLQGQASVSAVVGNQFLGVLKRLFGGKEKVSSREQLLRNDLRMKFLRRGDLPEKDKHAVTKSVLQREEERIKRMMGSSHSLDIYKPSFLGAVANLTTRQVSFFFIDNFPGFFRKLYTNLQRSNIRILSNTYVNIMVFCTLCVFGFSAVVSVILGFLTSDTVGIALFKALLLTIIATATTGTFFAMYPSARISTRRKNINTNLPFAINHMAAVAGGGIPPNLIFRLIGQSEEYGEISVECKKVSQFVDVFGYDLLTAIRAVAETNPSKQFREFLEGLQSTIESGGELQNYLEENGKEALVTYEIERQKYTEQVQTYSDIYTGILIAAPLFFVAALSLISVLGGGIGGFEVNVIIAMGTYLVIPALNVVFMIFLDANQPGL